MIQLYVKNAAEAIEIYSNAFGGKLRSIDYTPEKKILHSELLISGQVLAIADTLETSITGTVFQIDVRMESEEEVRKAYKTLEEDSQTNVPIGPVFFSPCMVDFIDKFGVRWCLFSV